MTKSLLNRYCVHSRNNIFGFSLRVNENECMLIYRILDIWELGKDLHLQYNRYHRKHLILGFETLKLMESNENLTPAGRWTLSLIADISVNYGQSANFVWLCSSILICWVLPFDWWLMVFPHDWCSLECTTLYLSTLPNLMIELERKDSNGIIKNCITQS